ncbi:MAG: hypothetical protein EP338_09095 [Bacteroidetes bacterium]|nr:MAG: hypothetical protein EP338_09095 [Bacteroidota bacterium]
MGLVLRPEQQIQRINRLLQQLEDTAARDAEVLKSRAKKDSWSPLEIMKHMSVAHQAYQEKIRTQLSMKTGLGALKSEFRAAGIPSFLIRRFPPIEGKIKLKMKTMKQFEPQLHLSEMNETELREVVQELKDCLEELKSWVHTYRTETISLSKFNSAIGAVVRFNIPEACEFILCHNERHFFQLDRAMNKKEGT